MPTRATRRVFWWYLSCFAVSVERTSVTIPEIPVLGGGWLYVSSTVRAELAARDREANLSSDGTTAVADAEADAARLLPAHQKCSLFLLTVRTVTLVVALVVLSLYGRLSPLVTELQNSSRTRDD